MSVSRNNSKIVLVQTVVPDYRRPVIEGLIAAWGDDFHFYFGDRYFQPDVKSDAAGYRDHATQVSNHYFLGRRILLQIGAIKAAVRARCSILELNPRILNTWIVVGLRRLLGRKTVLWGHAVGRNGDDKLIRKLLRRLADVILVYTEEQRAALLNQGAKSQVVLAAPNSLFRRADMTLQGSVDTRKSFIYVGRLVRSKKPDFLVRAFAAALPRLPEDCRLFVIGKGPMSDELRSICEELRVSSRVDLLGYLPDDETLGYYAKSVASVSPGYVGLSATQSLGYGIPMIISRNEPHAPEIEAAREGWNSVFFETDDIGSFADALVEMSNNREQWCSQSDEISMDCRRRYSIETMVAGFIQATDACADHAAPAK